MIMRNDYEADRPLQERSRLGKSSLLDRVAQLARRRGPVTVSSFAARYVFHFGSNYLAHLRRDAEGLARGWDDVRVGFGPRDEFPERRSGDLLALLNLRAHDGSARQMLAARHQVREIARSM